MGFGLPKGLDVLRRAIAAHLSALKGIKCHPQQVFITSGAQHAFSRVGGCCSIRAGSASVSRWPVPLCLGRYH
ncbi:hypothetical protein RA2_02731 [Roseovarius sp. A-2]|uniref:hypothetical protein n=1 Tax=Roseovarius sp. A-2 TaxID=1570360 RepID=UPI0009D5BE67|nr:hypothetical protein [Roseovarius sp. A-2]GAW35665.1 hypothetical protein RA2_02731 [Roseovarius sp. A-2]